MSPSSHSPALRNAFEPARGASPSSRIRPPHHQSDGEIAIRCRKTSGRSRHAHVANNPESDQPPMDTSPMSARSRTAGSTRSTIRSANATAPPVPWRAIALSPSNGAGSTHS